MESRFFKKKIGEKNISQYPLAGGNLVLLEEEKRRKEKEGRIKEGGRKKGV